MTEAVADSALIDIGRWIGGENAVAFTLGDDINTTGLGVNDGDAERMKGIARDAKTTARELWQP